MKQARGVPIDMNDRDGRPIHIGDTMEFDPSEWGGPKIFTVKLEGGKIVHPGATADLALWCRIFRAWDAETKPASTAVTLKLRPCQKCGKPFAPGEVIESIEGATESLFQHRHCPGTKVDADGYTACPSCGAVLQAGKDCLCGWTP